MISLVFKNINMKNFLLFSTICCCALVSCGGSNNSNGQDSKSKEDTSVVEGKIDTVSESVEKADLYTMTDGKFFDLKGNVKKCVVSVYAADENGNPESSKAESETTIEFDADGKYSVHSGYDNWDCVRNDNGSINKFTWYCSDFGVTFVDSVSYNNAGFPVALSSKNLGHQTFVFEYDADNELVSKSSTATYEEGVEGKTVSAYKILKRDAKGNWTKRVIDVTEGTKEFGAADYDYKRYKSLEIRKIGY